MTQSSEQVQLLVEGLHRPLGREGWPFAAVGARHFVFLAQVRDELRQALAVGGRKEGAVLIALAVVLGEMREVLLEEGKEHGGRAGLQKKRVGENVVGSGFGGGADHTFQVFRRIGDSWDDRRATHADAQSRLAQRAHGVDAEIGTRGARLENSRQFDIERRDRDVHGETIRLRDFFQQVEVADDRGSTW